MLTGLPKAKKVTTVTKIKKIIPVKLPFIFSKTLLYHEFKNIHCMDAKFLKLQLKYPLIGLFAPKYINK